MSKDEKTNINKDESHLDQTLRPSTWDDYIGQKVIKISK